MNKYCDITGVRLIPWALLCREILARAPSTEKTERSSTDRSQTGYSDVDKKIVKRVREIAEKKEWKMSHVAMVWINKRVTSPIIRLSSVEKIDEALDVREKEQELYEARTWSGINEMRIFGLHQRATSAEAHLARHCYPTRAISAFIKPALSHSLNYPAPNESDFPLALASSSILFATLEMINTGN